MPRGSEKISTGLLAFISDPTFGRISTTLGGNKRSSNIGISDIHSPHCTMQDLNMQMTRGTGTRSVVSKSMMNRGSAPGG